MNGFVLTENYNLRLQLWKRADHKKSVCVFSAVMN